MLIVYAIDLAIKNNKIRDKRVDIRNGSKNMSTWSNPLKYNLCDTIKKWYLFPDLGIVRTTNIKKDGFYRLFLCDGGMI